MEIKHNTTEKTHIVELIGRLDAMNNEKAESFFGELSSTHDLNIIVDMKDLDFINSSGLRVFIMTLKKQKSKGLSMILCNLDKNIKDVFHFSGFDKLFDIELDREQAIEKLG